jgi:hypothetical protein
LYDAKNLSKVQQQEKNDKISCGRKHFSAIGIDHEVATSMGDVLKELTARAMLSPEKIPEQAFQRPGFNSNFNF